jgi:hypothetical protein
MRIGRRDQAGRLEGRGSERRDPGPGAGQGNRAQSSTSSNTTRNAAPVVANIAPTPAAEAIQNERRSTALAINRAHLDACRRPQVQMPSQLCFEEVRIAAPSEVGSPHWRADVAQAALHGRARAPTRSPTSSAPCVNDAEKGDPNE